MLSSEASQIVREIARELKTPLIDYHAACLQLQPGDVWDRTLISDAGVPPAADKTNVCTNEDMNNGGYVLRN